MTVKEFLEKLQNSPELYAALPSYLSFLITILKEFEDEKCSVLLGKIMGNIRQLSEIDQNYLLKVYLDNETKKTS
jgi:hypothetical protein